MKMDSPAETPPPDGSQDYAEEAKLLEIEIDLLLQAIYLRHGYDFRNYSRASLRRRILDILNRLNISNVGLLIPLVLRDREVFDEIFFQLSVTVTEMFRDPSFFLSLRTQVLPILKSWPFVNIWTAGCATGEEAWSLAILLEEEGLYDRCRIYATDINDRALVTARDGLYDLSTIRNYADNYRKSGGKGHLTDFYLTRYSTAKLNPELGRNLVFSNHNLVTDNVFAEMQLVVCRNVMIYFNQELQQRVFRLFHESLSRHGVLALGKRESLLFSPFQECYASVNDAERIYQQKVPRG